MMARAREAIGGSDAEKIFLLATNVNEGGKQGAFCPSNGAVASCPSTDEFRDWTNSQGGANGWSDRQVSWYYRNPNDACKWAFHCKYSLNTVNQEVVDSTMRLLLTESAGCPSSGPNAGIVVLGVALALVFIAAAGFVYKKRQTKNALGNTTCGKWDAGKFNDQLAVTAGPTAGPTKMTVGANVPPPAANKPIVGMVPPRMKPPAVPWRKPPAILPRPDSRV